MPMSSIGICWNSSAPDRCATPAVHLPALQFQSVPVGRMEAEGARFRWARDEAGSLRFLIHRWGIESITEVARQPAGSFHARDRAFPHGVVVWLIRSTRGRCANVGLSRARTGGKCTSRYSRLDELTPVVFVAMGEAGELLGPGAGERKMEIGSHRVAAKALIQPARRAAVGAPSSAPGLRAEDGGITSRRARIPTVRTRPGIPVRRARRLRVGAARIRPAWRRSRPRPDRYTPRTVLPCR